MSLASIFKALWRKKFILLGVPAVCVAIAYFVTEKYFPAQYRSIAQISTGFTIEDGVDEKEAASQEEANTQFTNMIETMKSPLIVNQLSYNLIKHDLVQEYNAFRDASKGKLDDFNRDHGFEFSFSSSDISELEEQIDQKLASFELLNSNEEKLLLDLIHLYGYDYNEMIENLEVERITESDFLAVKFHSENPKLSAFVVNTISDEFIRYFNNRKSNNNTNNLDYLSRVVEQKKELLDRKTEELTALKEKSNVINPGYESGTRINQIRELEMKKEGVLETIRSLELQLEALDDKMNSVQETPSKAQVSQRIVELRDKITDLNKIYIESGSRNADVETALNRLRKELRNEMDKITSTKNNQEDTDDLLAKKEALELDLKIARNNLTSVETSINRTRINASGIASKQTQVDAMEQEVDKAMEEYLQTVKQYNQEKNKTLITESPIKLIIPGQPNDRPIQNLQPKAMVAAGGGSFILLLFLILFLQLLDTRIKSPKKFVNSSSFPLSGAVNLIDTSQLDLSKLFNKTARNPKYEAFKQSLRKFRYEIENNPNARVYLVTSPRRGDGKTFLILCLAYSLSLLNKKVLLVDTNFKNTALTETLMPDANYYKVLEEGTKLITDRNLDVPAEQMPTSIISHTTDENIDIIGSSRVNNSPSEIFSGKNFDQMLNQLLGHYDYIFMEGAALNEYSDTKELIKYVDKVVPVFSAQASIKQKDRETLNYMKSLNGKLTGAILNKVEFEEMEV